LIRTYKVYAFQKFKTRPIVWLGLYDTATRNHAGHGT